MSRRSTLIADFMDALDVHVKELIRVETALSCESNMFSTHATREELENKLAEVLDYVPEHNHSPRDFLQGDP